MESLDLAHLLVDSLEDKKGNDILLLDLRDHNVFADYFLICNGENERQLDALAQNIAFDAKKTADTKPFGIEGQAQTGWVLIDFGDVVVHLFSPEKRSYYRIEDIWDQGHIVLRMP